MFLGWYDPDKKIPARYKLEDALERYARKFGRPALTCITSQEDAAELEADKEAPTMPVRGVGFIPRYTFYVGIDEEAEAVVQPVSSSLPSAEERKSVRRKAPAVQLEVPESTTVVKTRRRSGAPLTTVAGSKPGTRRTVSDPGKKPETIRAKSNSESKPKKPPAKADQLVKSGAIRANPISGAHPKVTGAKTDQRVKRGAKRTRSESKVKPEATPATTDTRSNSRRSPAKTEQSVKSGAKQVTTEPGLKPGAKPTKSLRD